MSAPLPVALDYSTVGGAPAKTAPAASPTPPTPRTAAAHWWRRWRWPVAVAAAVLATSLATLVLLRPTSAASLDPANVAPDGTRALATVLREQGVDVRVRTRFADVSADLHSSGGTTVIIARPDLLVGGRIQDLRTALEAASADLVLVGADSALVTDLGVPAVALPDDAAGTRQSRCSDPVAVRAGTVVLGDRAYRPRFGAASGPASACYPGGTGGAAMLVLNAAGGGRTTLLGSGDLLTNGRLDDAGDAALALGLLGAHERLVWWTPDPLDTGATTPPTIGQLVPDGVRYAAWQLVVVLLVVALWRGRRLGRLVVEPLPVVVRSVETTLGRASLYRRARARGRAGQVLRAAAVRRLAVRCSLPRTAEPRDVALRVAARTGRPVDEVASLLAGPEPADDDALVTLARQLDALDTEVRRP